MTTSVSDIRFSSSLIQDYLLTLVPPVASTLEGKFVVVQAETTGPTAELLTANADGNLLHVALDSSSVAGWVLNVPDVPLPKGAASAVVSRIAAFYEAGILNVLVHFPAADGNGEVVSWMQKSADETWTNMPLTGSLANAVGRTTQTSVYSDPDGNNYLFGISANFVVPTFFLIRWDPSASDWQILVEMRTENGARNYGLTAGRELGELDILWVSGESLYHQAGQLVNGDWVWTEPQPSVYSLHHQGMDGGQVLALPGEAARSDLIVWTSDAQLILIQDYDTTFPTLIPLTDPLEEQTDMPRGVLDVITSTESSGSIVIFAIDSTTSQLWIKRQTGTDAEGHTQFADWIMLGNLLGTFGAPQLMGGGLELFTVDLSANISHLTQAADGSWFNARIQGPQARDESPTETATWTTDVTTLDASGHPTGPIALSVTADRATTIIAAGLSYAIGPSAPARIQTDATGKISIAVDATSITAPALTFVAGDVSTGATITRSTRADQQTLQRLANQDPTLPMTADALVTAGLISPDAADPDAAVQALILTAEYAQELARSPNGRVAVKLSCFELDFTASSGARFTRLTEAEVRTRRVAGAAAKKPGSIGSVLGDALSFAKNQTKSLKKVTVGVVDEIVTVTLELADSTLDFTASTVAQMGDVIETIFAKIVEGLKDLYQQIKDVLAWLRMLFEWADIANTHKVLRYCLESTLENVVNSAGAATTWIDENWDNMSSTIRQGLTQTGTVFSSSITSYVRSLSTPIGQGLDASMISDLFDAHASRLNYVWTRAMKTLDGATTSAKRTPRDNPLDSVIAMITADLDTSAFTDALRSLQNFLSTDPANILDSAVTALVTAADAALEIVLGVIKNIARAVLAVVSQGVDALRQALAVKIEVPIISWLFEQLFPGSGSLSISDVVTMGAAAPATILYKLIFQKAPFSDSDVRSLLASAMPWPSSSSSGAKGAESPWETLGKVLGTMSALLMPVNMFFEMSLDTLAAAESPIPVLETGLSVWSIALSFVGQGLGVPYEEIAAGSAMSSAQALVITLWSTAWVPFAIDVLSTFFGERKGVARLNEWGDFVGPALGLVLLGEGIATSVEQAKPHSGYGPWSIADNIVAPISTIAKALLLVKTVEALEALLAIDIAGNLGSTVTILGSTYAE